MWVARGCALCAVVSICLLSGEARAQQTGDKQPVPIAGGQQGGSATAGEFAPVLDSEQRPITAGGFVKTGPVIFKDISKEAGLTVWKHTMGTPQKSYILETIGSGVALLDYDNDGWLDIYIVNGSTEDALTGKTTPPHAALFHNNHDGTFTDVAAKAGVTNDRWGFGVAVGDYDNDGWKDLLMSDGHVYPQADKYNWGTSWKERPMLFHNIGGKRFEPVPAVAGTGLADVIAGRGMAVGDLFNDGKLDAVINVMDGHPVLLRNVSDYHNHWLELKLVGKTPRDAVGATVYLTANGMRQREDVLSGGSYLSSNDPRPHFGLGQATTVEKLEVRWPDGTVESFAVPGVDRILTLTEGTGTAEKIENPASRKE